MKKRILSLVTVLVLCLTLAFTTSCEKDEKVIYVCASELPHADVLENAVAPILKEKGYTFHSIHYNRFFSRSQLFF